ncbi:MAG TPA: DUF3300 domain-containing protein [Candidatus Angelobacter sp.]|jgi:hypothetical protein
MKRPLALLLIFAITFVVPSAGASALPGGASSAPAAVGQDDQQDDQYDTYFSSEELENLVAPIALYPDPLLAQVLLAATFPDQIDEAARTVRGSGSDYAIDSAPWDVSVKAVAHYPSVLSMMADKIDWTTSLGQAYVNQSTDLMDAVQRLRREASSAGYLVNSPQQEIVDTDSYLYIYPEQPEYIYVPVYDPAIVFVARPGFHVGPAIFFGTGFLIGAWLNHDCDWGGHRVFYHGWEGGPSWIERSRPHVHVTNIYVNNNYRNVVINRAVNNRRVNYAALNRYNTVHRDVDYNNVRRQRRGGAGPSPVQSRPGNDQRDNKIIRRNMDPSDPRIDANRGHSQGTQPQPQVRQPDIPRPDVRRPDTPQVRQPDTPRPEVRRPDTSRPIPATTLPMQVPRTTQAPPPQRQPEVQRPQSVFRGGGGGAGSVDTRAASQRGQESRQQQNRTVSPQQSPRQQAPNPQRGQQNQPHGRGR